MTFEEIMKQLEFDINKPINIEINENWWEAVNEKTKA